jgi:alkylation response protein AidB-like acyl-CoA dehydrogenase
MEAPPIDDLENLVVRTVADWIDAEVKPTVRAVEQSGAYPDQFIDGMKDLGLFGLCIPEPWAETRVSVPCFARVTEELARGWMSLAGALGGHSVVSSLIVEFGTDEQREKYLPRMATGELRATMALTEPDGGSDLQAMRTAARPDGDGYVVNGSKTWISNGRRSGLVALLCKTDANADPVHRGMSILLVETDTAGLVVSEDIPKLGYKGIEACELTFEDCRVPADALLGDEPGRGFAQMMRGLEIGRIQVAARAVGVGRAAYEDSFAYAQQRQAFGVPIWQHQSIGNYLADMATSLHASRLLVLDAAERLEAGKRVDLEAGMAKLFASETAMKIALDAIRIHGGYGYSTEYDVERYFRDAPLMIVGEGTNEIQRNVIVRQLVSRGGLL